MVIPKLEFHISVKKDVSSFFSFVDDAQYDEGRNLQWAVLEKNPLCRKWFFENTFVSKRSEVNAFVSGVYKKEATIISKNIILYEKNWKVVEQDFFLLVENLFKGYPWPRKMYVAYPTVWSMYPRFLESGTFQVPHRYRNKKYVNVVIAHEMLHFIFYDWFYKLYPKYKKNNYNMFVWHVSEIFNAVIQNSLPWLKVFKLQTMAYPEHEAVVFKVTNKLKKINGYSVDEVVKVILYEFFEDRKDSFC